MRPHKKHHHRRDEDEPPASALLIPVQTTFRHMPTSPSVAAHVEAEVQKLRRYCDAITRCHVVIQAPHRHHRHGRHYAVHVELSVPHAHLVIAHDPAAHAHEPHDGSAGKPLEAGSRDKDIYVVLREVFDSARRRLEDYVRRARGDVKRHSLAGADLLP